MGDTFSSCSGRGRYQKTRQEHDCTYLTPISSTRNETPAIEHDEHYEDVFLTDLRTEHYSANFTPISSVRNESSTMEDLYEDICLTGSRTEQDSANLTPISSARNESSTMEDLYEGVCLTGSRTVITFPDTDTKQEDASPGKSDTPRTSGSTINEDLEGNQTLCHPLLDRVCDSKCKEDNYSAFVEYMTIVMERRICEHVAAHEIVGYLDFIESREFKPDDKSPQAMARLLACIRNSDEPGKWTSFINALRHTENYLTLQLLEGQLEKDYFLERKLLQLLAEELKKNLKLDELLDIMFERNVINELDKQSIEATKERHGEIEAVGALLEKVPNRYVEWVSTFISSLRQSGHPDLANTLAELFSFISDESYTSSPSSEYSPNPHTFMSDYTCKSAPSYRGKPRTPLEKVHCSRSKQPPRKCESGAPFNMPEAQQTKQPPRKCESGAPFNMPEAQQTRPSDELSTYTSGDRTDDPVRDMRQIIYFSERKKQLEEEMAMVNAGIKNLQKKLNVDLEDMDNYLAIYAMRTGPYVEPNFTTSNTSARHDCVHTDTILYANTDGLSLSVLFRND